ncbi:MAG: hypothetical protein Q7O66_13805 [Dehalococcoidia bacterium]|nr:hypothetical protein [Dehalococcoidia bacterium]
MNVRTGQGKRVHDGMRSGLTGPVMHDTRCGFFETVIDERPWREVEAPVDCKLCLRDMARMGEMP